MIAFGKSVGLMRFAEIAAARHKGMSLVEGSAEFGVINVAMWG